jgi:hypothetical protein
MAVAVACGAISSQSFWIDETQTAFKAIPPTLHGWWQALYTEHNSNLQLPLYMIYIWGWARVSGVSEVALRAANIPWFFLGFFGIVHSVRTHRGFRNALLLIYCVHPFVWTYLNEARPYLMQLSGAMLVCGALFQALAEPEEAFGSSWWWLFGLGGTILCGSGLLGVSWAAAIGLMLLGQQAFRRAASRAGLPALLVFVPILLALGGYFVWTLRQGARPGETGMRPSSIPFVLYELLGFMGLGPGRAEMRTGGLRIFLAYLPALSALGIPMAYVFAAGAASRFGLPAGRRLALTLVIVIPAVFAFALGFAKDFLVLGRHLTPLFPFVLGATAYGLCLLWKRARPLDHFFALLLVAALTVSSLECRFAWRHQKDDYRGAAAIGKAALGRGQRVWWVAHPASATYYQLPWSDFPEPGKAQAFWKPALAELQATGPPDMIILSKPDLFDANSGVRDYIAQHHYTEVRTLPAFSFWTK